MTASAWLDNKVVITLSTNSQPSATGTVLRRQRNGTHIPVPCPESIISYNEHMGGVDRGDQLRGYYNCRTKSRKFYKYIFFCPTVVHKVLKDFRLQLAKDLIGDHCSRRRAGRGGGAIPPLPLLHFPSNKSLTPTL